MQPKGRTHEGEKIEAANGSQRKQAVCSQRARLEQVAVCSGILIQLLPLSKAPPALAWEFSKRRARHNTENNAGGRVETVAGRPNFGQLFARPSSRIFALLFVAEQ